MPNCNSRLGPKDHVPPRCFSPDPNPKKNLIKVPSCREHNSELSKDDEFARNIITMFHKNNNWARSQFMGKALSSFRHSPKLLDSSILSMERVITSEGMKGGFHTDGIRLKKFVKKVGYGLHFHKFQTRWECNLLCMTDSLIDKEKGIDDL